MKMYKCNECGHLFENGEEKTIKEYMGECHGSPAYQTIRVCPMCKGDFDEIEPCKICGTYEHDYGEEYCNDCKKDVQRRLDAFITEEFTEEEIKLLKELFEEQ